MSKPLKISEEAAVQMPMKTVASLIAMVAIGTWAYFGIIETQNRVPTQLEIMSKDLEMNTEFRIKWPRGQMGSLPADQEQFMMIEDLYKTVDRLNKAIEDGMHNKVNIDFLTKQMNKVLSASRLPRRHRAIPSTCKRASLISAFTNIRRATTDSIISVYSHFR